MRHVRAGAFARRLPDPSDRVRLETDVRFMDSTMTTMMHIRSAVWHGAVICALTVHAASAQRPVAPAALGSRDWAERARGFAGLPATGRSPDVLLRQLQHENVVIVGALRESNSERGASQKYGEGYAEYYEELLMACNASCDKRNPAAIRALANGAYSPSSPFARELAEQHGAAVLGLMLERSHSDVVSRRHGAVRMLEVTRLVNHSLSQKQQALIHEAVAGAARDAHIAVRLVAIDALGNVGSPEDVPALERIVNGRVTFRSGRMTTATEPERRAARAAIDRLKSR